MPWLFMAPGYSCHDWESWHEFNLSPRNFIAPGVTLSVAAVTWDSASDVYATSMEMGDHITPKQLCLEHVRYFYKNWTSLNIIFLNYGYSISASRIRT
jgi:hypothetical protein